MNPKQAELDMGMKCIKYMILVANFMFVMVGFLLISIGSTVVAIYDDFEAFMKDEYFSPGRLLIAIGVLIFFVSLFGCVGAFKESTCLINTYTICLAAVLILEISASIAAYTMRANLETKINKEMQAAMKRFDDDYYKYAWDSTQELLHCCGIDDFKDWGTRFNSSNMINIDNKYYVPDSCCRDEEHTDVCESQQKINKDGCLSKLTYVVSECALLLGIGGLCVSFIQLLGIIFSHMLAKSIRRLKTQILVERQENRRQFYEQMSKEAPAKVTPVLYTPSSSEA